MKIIFVIYSNIKSLCCLHGTKTVGQLYFKIKQTNQLVDKEIRPVVTRGKEWEMGEMDELLLALIFSLNKWESKTAKNMY